MSLSADILNHVDQVTLGYTAQAYQGIVDSHMLSLRLMLVAYFAFYGVAVLKGLLPLTMKEIVKHVLMAFVVFELATNWGSFTVFCYDVFTKGPDGLISALVGGAKPSEQLSQVFEQGIETGVLLFKQAEFSGHGISMVIFGLLVFLATVLMVGFALFLVIFSKLGLAVLLSLGPIFIALSLWKSTKGLFQGWINYLVNLALIPVMTFALLGLILSLVQSQLGGLVQAGESIAGQQVLAYLLIMVISILLFSQVMSIAASLGGGIALSTMGGFKKAASMAVNAPLTLAKGAMKATKAAPKIVKGAAAGGKMAYRGGKAAAQGAGKAYQWTRNVGVEEPKKQKRILHDGKAQK